MGWVKAHKIERGRDGRAILSPEEQGNHEVDQISYDFLHSERPQGNNSLPRAAMFELKHISTDKPLTVAIPGYLKRRTGENHIAAFLSSQEDRKGISIAEGIHWGVFKRAVNSLPGYAKISFLKFLWGLLGTSLMLSRRQAEEIDGNAGCKLCEKQGRALGTFLRSVLILLFKRSGAG